MKYIKEDLEDLIFNKNLSYREIGKIYGVSDTYIKKVAGKLGISLKKRANFPEGFKPANYGKGKPKEPKTCLFCHKEHSFFGKKYCSIKCQAAHKHETLYQDFIENNDKYCRENYSPKSFKDKFLDEQNYECNICGITNKWNGKNLVFVLDHIDGNASNNQRKNLRLVCPNCDSQLDTYKSKNKNSAREYRYTSKKKIIALCNL